VNAGVCDISGSGIGGTGAPSSKNNGSGIGGTGSPLPKKNGSGIGGTGAIANESGIGGTGQKTDNQASIIIGTITGFGSICVNGVEIHYAASTPIQINGEASNTDQLALGQVVSVNVSGTGHEVYAKDIQVMNIISGPVTEIDSQLNQVTVLGQKVHLSDKTHFSDVKVTLANIQKGSFIQVSGLRQNDGGIVASRIANSFSANRAQITGIASDITENGFKIRGVSITTLNKPSVKAGQHVRVSGLMEAEKIMAKQIMVPKLLEGQKFKIEGLVNIDTKEQLIKIGPVTLKPTDEIKNILVSLPKNKVVIIDGSVKVGHELKVEHLFIKDSINTYQSPSIDQHRPKDNVNIKRPLNTVDSHDNNDQKKEINSDRHESPLEIIKDIKLKEPDFESHEIKEPEIEIAEEESPEIETPEIEKPEVDAPEIEVSEVETPEIEVPEVEVPEVETPEIEIPEVEVPEVETPEIEIPEVETPEIEIPEVEVPEVETPEIEIPEVEVPEVETPEIEIPEVEVPEVETPEIEVPEVEVPEVETPEIEIPEVEVPEVETPEIEVPEVEVPEIEEPEIEVPEVED